ncbi:MULTISPECIES: conjugative transposon protein TraN [unclassified Flavobacterium]|uniref:conjugative transposon protein TraN n=1 Tax=unclassified Flavobacterium TaxID=196869 RepID=UPI00086CA7EC|nr:MULTISPECIES: conjugative transposon protein TraN [unclassified Flavobacterium]MBN9284131.1 conjugative transposon protein TraN [Flavobacterium sp.]ODS83599.1 MAG: conjugative transposon protein TraN [Chryseobacterium sp. SCN 40-13]OJV71145.1 MAG: conjugative transposon protein TraN [Flavobacterium sp. 40-81]
MKKISVAVVMIMGFFLFIGGNLSALAQKSNKVKTTSIQPYRLEISFLKTSNIVFPQAIVSVDRGSRDILVQKAKGVENILQIKAAKEDFQETNLTVVTADGKINSFVINYSKQPAMLNLSLTDDVYKPGTVFLSPEHINKYETEIYAQKALTSKNRVKRITDVKFGMLLQLNGIFIQNNLLYARIKIENFSNLNYDVEQLRFFIRDKKKSKRTASQENEVMPVFAYQNTDKIIGKSAQNMVFSLPKFTIPDDKLLIIQLMEKNGGRHLELEVNNTTIVKSTVLPKI